MGGGSYCITSACARSTSYAEMDSKDIFTQTNINNAMAPYGITVRESRDSDEHPNSMAIILGLDVTGSMGSVPNYLVKEGREVIAFKIDKKHNFHDIDYKSDLNNLNYRLRKKKKKGQ